MQFDLTRRLAAEALGTLIWRWPWSAPCIMAEKLAGGNSGARAALQHHRDRRGAVRHYHHLRSRLRRAFQSGGDPRRALSRRARCSHRRRLCRRAGVGGCVGAVLAHLMFGLDLIQLGSTARTGVGQWAGEFIATFGLIGTILGCIRFKPEAVATAVVSPSPRPIGSPPPPRSPILP